MNNTNTDLLSALTREGVLINASVRYPRFHKKLSPADLGLAPDQVSERLVSLVHKRLLPKEALAELALVEGRTHAILDKGTFPFLGGIGTGRRGGRNGDAALLLLLHPVPVSYTHLTLPTSDLV